MASGLQVTAYTLRVPGLGVLLSDEGLWRVADDSLTSTLARATAAKWREQVLASKSHPLEIVVRKAPERLPDRPFRGLRGALFLEQVDRWDEWLRALEPSVVLMRAYRNVGSQQVLRGFAAGRHVCRGGAGVLRRA